MVSISYLIIIPKYVGIIIIPIYLGMNIIPLLVHSYIKHINVISLENGFKCQSFSTLKRVNLNFKQTLKLLCYLPVRSNIGLKIN